MKNKKVNLKKINLNLFKFLLPLLIIIFGSIVILAIIFPNGDYNCSQKNDCSLSINVKYYHDALWHIALTRSGLNNVPFTHPSQSGSPLIGYNFLLNLIMFVLMKIGISPWFSFFKLLPLIFIFVYPFLILRYSKLTKKSYSETNAILFFAYFGCSLGFLISYLKYGVLENTALWEFPSAQTLQSATVLYNLQFAYSLLTVLFLLPLLFKDNLNKKDVFNLFIMTFLATGFKLYAGLTILSLFFFNELYRVIKNKRFSKNIFSIFIPIILAFCFSVFLFYNPLEAKKSGSIFVFSPFSFTHQMIENPLLFYSRSLANARYYLYSLNTFSKKLVFIEFYSCILFLLYNLGSRIIIFPYLVIKAIQKKIDNEDFALFLTYFCILTFTIFFIQKGDWFNTMQFLFYGIFLMNLLAGKTFQIYYLNKNILIKVLVVILIFIFTFPGNIDLLSFYHKSQKLYVSISAEEIKALQFLEKQPQGVVFTPTIIPELYITALTGKPSYLNDIQQLRIMGIDFSKREKIIKNLKNINLNSIEADYFYFNKNRLQDKMINTDSLVKIYNTQNIFIFKKK